MLLPDMDRVMSLTICVQWLMNCRSVLFFLMHTVSFTDITMAHDAAMLVGIYMSVKLATL
jgi:hypothetical protein